LYKIKKLGCCGAPNTYSYFSLQDGRKLYSSHVDDIIEISLPSKYYPQSDTIDAIDRYVSYIQDESHDSNGNATAMTGVLQYGSAERVLRELEVHPSGRNFVLLPGGLTILYNGKRYSGGSERLLTPWKTPGGMDKYSKSLSDFVISLVFVDGTELKIPVEHDDISIKAKAVGIPKGFALKAR
jgi:hypothetical protein